ncbi:DMT family transporter [Candidatus Peregrinibacteria bacterium]|nr:DMT family transporter [Candidatus Peregrinibacteria bacterium]
MFTAKNVSGNISDNFFTMDKEKKGYLELILFSLFAGVVGIFVKLIQNLDIYSIIFFRALIASIFIFMVILAKKNIKELKPQYPFQTLLVGIFQGLAIFFYFASVIQTSVSNGVFLLYTAPIFSIIFTKLFFKEKIEKKTIIGIIITLSGIIFILNPQTFSFNSKETF